MTGVLTADRPPKPAAPRRYTVALARDEDDVRAAQRLRHDVFAGEMGALLASPQPGHDVDAFDAYCDHLLVREETTGQVVGTYRLLPPERAAVAGRLYAESEFDLAALDPIRSSLVEVGRSCVHPDHRDGAVIGLVWAGIARYMTDRGHAWLAGCCSSRSPTAAPSPPEPGTGCGPSTWRPRSTGYGRCCRGSPARRRPPPAPSCRRCCAATSGWAPGSAASPRTTWTSASRTCTYCCR